ncbi:F-box and WD repeat domain-containing 11-B-like [Clytia hemisphaerica]|uniref:F-box domain-containing protein n=1 Tax=Clytia hemisphaerica TaxID=252671 RepID=A0A7M5WX79_9CNID
MEKEKGNTTPGKQRKCFSMDDTTIEKLIHQERLSQQTKLLNMSMNSLPMVSDRMLLNFLSKQTSKVKASELCKIAREINSSQPDDLSLNLIEHKKVIEGQKYHSWPKNNLKNFEEKHAVKYHNYGLQEEENEHLEESSDDLLGIQTTGSNTARSWASPSELNVIDGKNYKKTLQTAERKRRHSCPCLPNRMTFNKQTVLNAYSSLMDICKSVESDDFVATENLEVILNNDFKSKFQNTQNFEETPPQRRCSLDEKIDDFDQVYNSVFKHGNLLDLIEEENKELHSHLNIPIDQQSLLSENLEKDVDSSTLSIYNQTTDDNESSDSDSGVGHISQLLPAFSHHDVGVEPPLFKKRADVMMQWFSGFSNEQKNIFIQKILESSELPQMHMLSLKMENNLHKNCPLNCRDMLQWLPENVVYQILDQLDPISLSNACQVNRVWHEYGMHHHLWKKFCRHPDYQLSSQRQREQILKFTNVNGTVRWREVFVERYCLRRNWMTGRCKVKTLTGHTQGVSCVQFDQSRIVSGSSDKTIRVWDLTSSSQDPVLHLVGHSGTVRCLQLIGNRLVSGSTDTTIKVWDLSVGSDWNMAGCRVTMIGHFDTVRCLQVDADKVISGSYDKTLKVWDLKTGNCKLTLRGHSEAVLCVQFDDQKIVSGSSDKTIKVWSLFTGVCLSTFQGHDDAVTCLQFNHSHVISGSLDCTLKFWNLHSGKCIGTIDWIRSEGHTRVVRCLQADRWKIVSAGDDKTLKIWCLESGERFVTLHKHTDGVTCLRFDDFMIVSGSYDKTVKVWDFLP